MPAYDPDRSMDVIHLRLLVLVAWFLAAFQVVFGALKLAFHLGDNSPSVHVYRIVLIGGYAVYALLFRRARPRPQTVDLAGFLMIAFGIGQITFGALKTAQAFQDLNLLILFTAVATRRTRGFLATLGAVLLLPVVFGIGMRQSPTFDFLSETLFAVVLSLLSHRLLLALNQRRMVLMQRNRVMLAEIKTLKGLVPVCSYCRKVRDDQGFWEQLESFVSRHTYASFSHGICPNCLPKVKEEVEASRPSGTGRLIVGRRRA